MARFSRLEQMTRGWFIGNFQPTFFQTPLVEVGYLTHPAGELWEPHYQRQAWEINLLLSGTLRLTSWPRRNPAHTQTTTVTAGTLFQIPPGEVVAPEFIEACQLVVVKLPSDPADKVLWSAT